MFYCFFCGYALDVINFVREYEGISFFRALSYLEYNFSVPKISSEALKDDLYTTLKTNTPKLEEDKLLKLYEYCDSLIVKRKQNFSLESYSKLFLFLEATVCKLRDNLITVDEAFNQFSKVRKAVESK